MSPPFSDCLFLNHVVLYPLGLKTLDAMVAYVIRFGDQLQMVRKILIICNNAHIDKHSSKGMSFIYWLVDQNRQRVTL